MTTDMAGTGIGGGETAKDPSGFTVDTLNAHFSAILSERDRRYEQRFEAQEEAIRRAEQATEKRFESVNEFRAQLADQATRFMPRDESIQRHDATGEKITAIEARFSEAINRNTSRLDLMTGRSTGLDKGWALLVGAIVAAGGIVGLVVAATQ